MQFLKLKKILRNCEMLAFRCSSTRSSCPDARTSSNEQLKILADHFLLSYYSTKISKTAAFLFFALVLRSSTPIGYGGPVHRPARSPGPYTPWLLATVKRKVHSTQVTLHEEFTRGIKDAILEIQRNSQGPWYANSIVIDMKLRVLSRLLSELWTTCNCYHVIKTRVTTPTP